jgi:MFS family permease
MFEQVLPRMRGITASLYIIIYTLFGIGIGPFVVGMSADANGGDLAAAILSINWVAPAIVVMLIALALCARRDEERLIERARRGGEVLTLEPMRNAQPQAAGAAGGALEESARP